MLNVIFLNNNSLSPPPLYKDFPAFGSFISEHVINTVNMSLYLGRGNVFTTFPSSFGYNADLRGLNQKSDKNI